MKSPTNETWISDHHKLIYTFLKSTYAKEKPKFVYYRCLKNFNRELLKKNLSENLKSIGNSFEVFYDTFTNTLDCYVPLKKKKIRFNHNKFMTKKLRKEVMTRSRLSNTYNKIAHTRTDQTIKSSVPFARTFWRKQKLITLTTKILKILLTGRGSGPLWSLFLQLNPKHATT